MTNKEQPLTQEGATTDRRSGKRHMTVFKVARMACGGEDDLCLIRNISDRGVMIETPQPLRQGDQVTVEIRSDKSITGTVRWARANTAGIEFDHAVAVDRMLGREPLGATFEQPRSPRFQRAARFRLNAGQFTANGETINLSLSGACLGMLDAHALRNGESVVATIEGLPALRATVRWIEGRSIGIQFEQPIHFRQLEQWLRKHASFPLTSVPGIEAAGEARR